MPAGRKGTGGWRRRALLAVIAALYAVSIPWYRDAGAEPRIWLGLPDWVVVALVCYVGVAILNAWVWLGVEVADREPSDDAR